MTTKEMRQTTDPFADRAAKALFESQDPMKIYEFMGQMATNDFAVPWDPKDYDFDMPEELIEYFNDYTHFEFTEEEKATIDRSCDVFQLYGPFITLILGVRSLLKQYSATDAIQVLRMTTLLEEHTNRRIMETMQFVLDVMTPGWFIDEKSRRVERNHYGIRSIQKLRLVHAMIRYRIWNNMQDESQGKWDDAWGQPINQEDMIFAVGTFNIEVIQGLLQLGLKLSDQQIEDYFQAWILIGKALGVEEKIIPKSYEEGLKLQQGIYERNFSLPNEYGPKLAQALIDWLVEIIPLAGSDTIIAITDVVNGPENHELLEKHLQINFKDGHHDLETHLAEDFKFGDKKFNDLESEGDRMLFLMEKFNNLFLRSLYNSMRPGKNTKFRISDGFQLEWGLNEDLEEPQEPTGIWGLIVKFIEWISGLFKKKKD